MPHTRKDPVVEDFHGRAIEDPYRWLEIEDDPQVVEWTEEQNRLTRQALDGSPSRERVHARLQQLLSIGALGTPSPRRGRYFYMRRQGDQNHAVLYLREGAPDAPERVILDPNAWSADGTEALDWYYPDRSGRLLAYGRSSGGDEWSTLRILDVDTGEHLPDEIARARAASVSWVPDGSGFFYTRYPGPSEVPEGEESYHRRVYFHALGSAVAEDPLIFGEGREKEDWPGTHLSKDGRYLLVTVSVGWTRTDLYLLDRETGDWTTLVEGEEALYDGELYQGRLFLHTNSQAPRYRLFVVDLEDTDRSKWQEVLPESEWVLEWTGIVGGVLFASYLADATSRFFRFDLHGGARREIPLPTLGSLGGIGGEWDGHELFYGFSSFTVPPTVYRYDLLTGETELWGRVEADVDPDGYEIHQVRYTSKDGTSVPMFVVHRKGLARDGDQPTLLSGYGGFNLSMTPGFSRANFLWLENGGVYAVANLRGGGEYGTAWHEGGRRGHKQNVFDDFTGAAEWLIANGYTRPERLAIYGGSNGGLLVGAALTQRPELFRAVVCAVPLLDMLRYHHFRIARLWIPEYGSPEVPEEFAWLHAYSPYHRVRDGERYPAVLLTTGASDSRVDPMHARKMAARLQEATGSDLPILLRVETRAGHGAGKPLAKVLEESADVWTFLFDQLQVEDRGHGNEPVG